MPTPLQSHHPGLREGLLQGWAERTLHLHQCLPLRPSLYAALGSLCSKESHITNPGCSETKPLLMPMLKWRDQTPSSFPGLRRARQAKKTSSIVSTFLQQQCDSFPNVLSRAFMFIQLAFSQVKEKVALQSKDQVSSKILCECNWGIILLESSESKPCLFSRCQKPEVHEQKNPSFRTSCLCSLWKDTDKSSKREHVSFTLMLLWALRVSQEAL